MVHQRISESVNQVSAYGRRFTNSPTHRSSGQSLLELIVALGVILAGVLGGLTLVISSITAARRTQQQIIAQNLAREGLELVRSVRDSNWLDPNYPTSPDAWDRGLIDTTPDPDDPTAAPVIDFTCTSAETFRAFE